MIRSHRKCAVMFPMTAFYFWLMDENLTEFINLIENQRGIRHYRKDVKGWFLIHSVI